jgi:hypothetical protein
MVTPGAAAARRISRLQLMFLAVGAHYVVPDFAWVQDVGGSLMLLADQVRRAIAWVYENAGHLGIDWNRIYIGGQSSGGHLAAVALTTDWPRDFGLPCRADRGRCRKPLRRANQGSRGNLSSGGRDSVRSSRIRCR